MGGWVWVWWVWVRVLGWVWIGRWLSWGWVGMALFIITLSLTHPPTLTLTPTPPHPPTPHPHPHPHPQRKRGRPAKAKPALLVQWFNSNVFTTIPFFFIPHYTSWVNSFSIGNFILFTGQIFFSYLSKFLFLLLKSWCYYWYFIQ